MPLTIQPTFILAADNTDEISFQEYKKIINAALNYPWDMESLKLWEIKQGYAKADDFAESEFEKKVEEYQEINQEITRDKNKLDQQIKNQLIEAERQYNEVVNQPQSMDVVTWLKEKKRCKTAIQLIKEGNK